MMTKLERDCLFGVLCKLGEAEWKIDSAYGLLPRDDKVTMDAMSGILDAISKLMDHLRGRIGDGDE